MTMSTRQTLKALSSLYRIVEAGERGYAVAAANVNNRGLKLLFKSFAQQRANFKAEIFTAMQQLKGQAHRPGHSLSSLLAIIHRGRIDIFAALTIGDQDQEKMVLKEVLLGERVALRTYEKSLAKDLPSHVQSVLARQLEEVRRVVDQVQQMRGRDGQRLLVRLYDTEKDADRAVESLAQAGWAHGAVDKLPVDKSIVLYMGKGTTSLETILSGAVGGAFWGALTGLLAVIGVLQLPAAIPTAGPIVDQRVWALIALLLCIAGGVFVGAIIGAFIGWGIGSGDAYLYDRGLERGRILVRAQVDQARSSAAWRLLAQVNREAHGGTREALA